MLFKFVYPIYAYSEYDFKQKTIRDMNQICSIFLPTTIMHKVKLIHVEPFKFKLLTKMCCLSNVRCY